MNGVEDMCQDAGGIDDGDDADEVAAALPARRLHIVWSCGFFRLTNDGRFLDAKMVILPQWAAGACQDMHGDTLMDAVA